MNADDADLKDFYQRLFAQSVFSFDAVHNF